MKIALAWIDASDPTDRTVAVGLKDALIRRGHQVCLVGPRRRVGEPFRQIFDGTTLYRVGPQEGLAVRQLLRIHAAEAVDVWHCHVFARDHRAPARAARLGHWRMLVTLHLILKDYLPFLGGVRGLRSLLSRAYRVTAVSRAAEKEFLGLFPGWAARSAVVYNGGSEPLVVPSVAARVRNPYILCVARLAFYKGHDLLLMAFARLLQEKPDMRLVLCGRDQLRGRLGRIVRLLGLEGRVVMTGQLSPGAVAALVRGCEFLVQPSRRENFPLAVLEAMAAGKPVVAAAAGGLVEMLHDGEQGFLVPPEDVETLSRRMLALARDRALRRRMGRAARRRSRLFTWNRAAARYERLYRVAP